jgi:dihydroxyacid dehydratase/phosphogluconate dehydratase
VTSSSAAPLHPVVRDVTARICARSEASRATYLEYLDAALTRRASRGRLSCVNLAHVCAAADAHDKRELRAGHRPNLAIISAYNDLLSAHQPLANYRALIKQAAHEAGAVAQFAGGVPAMCDGITQGQPGMELSLFSCDVIAMAPAVALVTGGRMSGGSGSVPAAIHVTPECVAGGPLGRVRDGDMIRLDADPRTLTVLVAPEILAERRVAVSPAAVTTGHGRELFASLRAAVGDTERGALA